MVRSAPYWLLEVALAVVLLPLVTMALVGMMAGYLGEMVMGFVGTTIERVERIGKRA